MLRTNRTRLLGATMLAGLLACAAPAAKAATTATIPGNVSSIASSATKVGTAADDTRVTIAVHLALRNTDALKQFVDEVSKPGTTQYGHYLSKSAFRVRFAPDDADAQAVKTLLKTAGMTNLHVGAANNYVSATATVAQLRATFGITQDTYLFNGKTLRANKEAPSVPAELAGKIRFIEGLDDTTFLKQPHHVSATQGELVAPSRAQAVNPEAAPAVTPPPVSANLPSPYCDTYYGDLEAKLSTKPGPYPATLPWLGCGYTPQQIQQAYGLDKVQKDGTGITIAIIDAYASPTIVADGNAYAQNHGLPPLTIANFSQIVPVGIYNVSPSESCGPYGWWGEESLDVAAAHGSALGATIVYIGARDCGTSLTVALADAVYQHLADIYTNSYSYNGEFLDPASIASNDETFMAAASLGETLLFSSGDDGDLDQSNGVATGAQEADSPYVTGVGGTTLGLINKYGAKKEWGWGTYRAYLTGVTVNSGTSVTDAGLATTSASGYNFYAFSFYSGAGGGISPSEAQPSYQAGIVPTSLATTLNSAAGASIPLSQPQRVSPDVAMVADPYTGYLIGESFTPAGNAVSDAGCTPTSSTTEYCELGYGGTSLASPLMAGMLAVVDQARVAKGKPVVGFANPWLYGAKIGTAPMLNGAGINDITAPSSPRALLRGYVTDLTRLRVVTISSVPFLIDTAPYGIFACGNKICEGIDDVFNYTAAGYDDVTGLGVPWAPNLIKQ